MRAVVDRWLAAPTAVIGNLRFTRGGVYAEFKLAGQPGAMAPHEQLKLIAEGHRPLVRQLPSGLILSGVLAPVDPGRVIRRMLAGYEQRPGWVREVRDWEPYLRIEPFWERVFTLAVPVDAGMAGRAGAGRAAKAWGAVLGRDHDDDTTLAGYQQLAARIAEKIPRQFAPTPLTPRQIRWLVRRHWSRGAADTPFPHGPGGPARLAGAEVGSARFDEGDQGGRRRRWWPSFAPVLRVACDGAPDSYQALLAVAQLPRGGLAYPRAQYLLAVDDVDVDATVDWYQHVTMRPADKALLRVDRAQRNLADQVWQRSGRRASHSDLDERYDAAEEYNAELRASRLERETEFTTVIAVGSASREQTARAVAALRTEFAEQLQTTLLSPRGAQRALWQLGHPGSEERAPRSQFGQPTTTEHWARFAPLLSCELGHDTGILVARNMATRRPCPVLVDLEGAVYRRATPGLLLIGAPGGGKSQAAKRIVDGLIKRGSRVSVIDPGSLGEWVPALQHHGDAVAVLDPARGRVSLDGLRLFPREVAVEYLLDHLLPMMGVEPESVIAAQLRFLLRPDQRVAESLGGLLRYLDALTGAQRAEYAELTARLGMWASVDYLRAMFDESLPAPPLREKDAVVWLTGDLELPTSAQTDNVHLYRRQSTRARAGLALYGMIAALTRVANTQAGRFGFLVAEECRTFLASPPGQAETVRITTQGRKEHTGFIGISQAVEHFDAIDRQYLPMRVITPFKANERDYARQAFSKMGIDPAEYPEVLETRTVPGHGYAYFVDDQGRAGLVDLLAPAQRGLVDAFDTTELALRVAAGRGAGGGS